MKFQRYFGIMTLLLAAQTGLAQQTLQEQINVVRAYRPVLADAVKIKKNPQLNDTSQVRPQLNYQVTDEKLSDNSNPAPVPAREPGRIVNAFTPYLYGKAGAGNLGSLLGEIYFNNKQDEDNQYGLFLQHNSAKGDADFQQYGRTAVGGFGKFNLGSRASVNVNAAYRQRSNHIRNMFEARDTDPTEMPIFDPGDSASIKQNFNVLEGEVEVASLRSANSEFVYGLKLGGYTLSDEFSSKENNFYLTALIGKQMGTFSINLSGNIDMTNAEWAVERDAGSEIQSFKNPIYRFQPYILAKNGSLTFKGGINLVGISGENAFEAISKKMFIFPDVSVDFQLIPKYLALFGGVNGDITKNTINDFSEQNAYMRHFGGLGNSREKYNIFGGIRGSFSSSVGFKAQFEHSKVDFQRFIVNGYQNEGSVSSFYNPDSALYEFGVYTAGEGGKRTTLSAELNIRYTESFRMNLGASSYQYEDEVMQRAWNIPTLKLYVSPTYNYRDKLFLTADLFYFGERNAYLGETTEGGQQYQVLDPYADLNFGATYKINQNFGVFLNANNILNTQYQRYLNYQGLGFTVVGGLTFSL